MTISDEISLHHRPVLASTMAYRETGRSAAPHVLFLHGNPTSSYIWRNIMPLVAPVGHCIAPDLIGYGQSGKPDIAYRFFDQADYLDALIDELGITSAYLVAQDWGTALAFHLTRLPGRRSANSVRRASARRWFSTTTRSSSACCPARSCAHSATRRWQPIALRSQRARAASRH